MWGEQRTGTEGLNVRKETSGIGASLSYKDEWHKPELTLSTGKKHAKICRI